MKEIFYPVLVLAVSTVSHKNIFRIHFHSEVYTAFEGDNPNVAICGAVGCSRSQRDEIILVLQHYVYFYQIHRWKGICLLHQTQLKSIFARESPEPSNKKQPIVVIKTECTILPSTYGCALSDFQTISNYVSQRGEGFALVFLNWHLPFFRNPAHCK